MNGYHIIAYDLTSAQDGGSEAFTNPSVRVGNLKVRLQFSEPTKIDLTLLVIAEFNSVIEMSSSGLVMTSYTSK